MTVTRPFSDETLLVSLGRDPAKVRRARQFLEAAHRDGHQGTEELESFARSSGATWDALTVYLAIAMERTPPCRACEGSVMCAAGRTLYRELEKAEDAYLRAAGPHFEGSAIAEYRAWQAAEDRLQGHHGWAEVGK